MSRLHIYWDWDYENLEEEMNRRNPRGEEILKSVRRRLSCDLRFPVAELVRAQREIDKLRQAS